MREFLLCRDDRGGQQKRVADVPKFDEKNPHSLAYDLSRFLFRGQGWQQLLGMDSQIRQGMAHGLVDGVRAVAVEAGVDFFEAADEVEDLVSGVGTSGGGAEMRAATEWAGLVDEAAGGYGIEQWAGSVSGLGQFFSAGGTEGFGGDESLAAREAGNFSGKMELATFGAECAVPFQWQGCKLRVDFLNLGG